MEEVIRRFEHPRGDPEQKLDDGRDDESDEPEDHAEQPAEKAEHLDHGEADPGDQVKDRRRHGECQNAPTEETELSMAQGEKEQSNQVDADRVEDVSKQVGKGGGAGGGM